MTDLMVQNGFRSVALIRDLHRFAERSPQVAERRKPPYPKATRQQGDRHLIAPKPPANWPGPRLWRMALAQRTIRPGLVHQHSDLAARNTPAT